MNIIQNYFIAWLYCIIKNLSNAFVTIHYRSKEIITLTLPMFESIEFKPASVHSSELLSTPTRHIADRALLLVESHNWKGHEIVFFPFSWQIVLNIYRSGNDSAPAVSSVDVDKLVLWTSDMHASSIWRFNH